MAIDQRDGERAVAQPETPVPGQPAPTFRLPTAGGGEVDLAAVLSRGPAIVYFSRGLGCPLCRRHRAQLTMGYEAFKRLGAEVLEVTPSTPEQAALYFTHYTAAF